MRIKFTRGDTKRIPYNLYDVNGNELVLNPDIDEMYFTVKTNYNTEDYLIQKTLAGGGITRESDMYVIKVDSVDTDDLAYGTYYCDIEIKTPVIGTKTMEIGTFKLTYEATFASNEGGV